MMMMLMLMLLMMMMVCGLMSRERKRQRLFRRYFHSVVETDRIHVSVISGACVIARGVGGGGGEAGGGGRTKRERANMSTGQGHLRTRDRQTDRLTDRLVLTGDSPIYTLQPVHGGLRPDLHTAGMSFVRRHT